MDMPKEHDVKCPECGADLKLEAASMDEKDQMKKGPSLKKPMAPKPNAAKMPMDSLKSVIKSAQPQPPQPPMGAM